MALDHSIRDQFEALEKQFGKAYKKLLEIQETLIKEEQLKGNDIHVFEVTFMVPMKDYIAAKNMDEAIKIAEAFKPKDLSINYPEKEDMELAALFCEDTGELYLFDTGEDDGKA